MRPSIHDNPLQLPGVGYRTAPTAVREGQAEVSAHRCEALDPVRRNVETEMKAWERWLERPALEKTIKRLYLSAEAASRAAAREISKTSPMSFPDARRIVLKSLKQASHGHVQELRRELAETEGVVEKCVR